MQSVIHVNLPQDYYEIAIAPNSIAQIGNSLKQLNLGKKILLVSNPEIFSHYGATVVKSLEAASFDVSSQMIPPGEEHKTLASIEQIYNTALANYLERSSTLIALGGGVIGDMTGFAAATWLRGIKVVQIPTSLLAMVDASIGGKTGVNHPKGKNLIGAFHQPRLVLIDPEVLKTLPAREFRAGMAEVIKYGVIWDSELFATLEKAERLDHLDYLDQELLQKILTRSCQAKADVVSKDEKEAGLRAILNYGHTIAHAIETLTGYNSVNHGEAVGIGMVLAGEIAAKIQIWSQEDAQRQNALIKKAGLPTKVPPSLKIEAILAALKSDKKVRAGKIRFVLPTQIGEAIVSEEVSSETIREVLKQNLSSVR